jgi:hypothetical protein
MKWPSELAQAQIAVMLFAILGPGILYSLWPSLEPSFESYWWPSVNGKVISLFAQPKENNKGEICYFGRARYTYNVQGKQYVSELTCFGDNPRSTEEKAIDDVAQFRPGKTVPVYYKPRNPAVGVVMPGMFAHQMAGALMLIGVSLIGFVVCVRNFGRWLDNRKTLPKHILNKFVE